LLGLCVLGNSYRNFLLVRFLLLT